ncbi:hypothetical protein CCMA1212_002690 [Trichoderma ghanense]|uniref:Uncharacterized protein n=1 Tax=Trichoderma ghanense TaxID=65468 RepID=A0ABY2HCU8_9HYPO
MPACLPAFLSASNTDIGLCPAWLATRQPLRRRPGCSTVPWPHMRPHDNSHAFSAAAAAFPSCGLPLSGAALLSRHQAVSSVWTASEKLLWFCGKSPTAANDQDPKAPCVFVRLPKSSTLAPFEPNLLVNLQPWRCVFLGHLASIRTEGERAPAWIAIRPQSYPLAVCGCPGKSFLVVPDENFLMSQSRVMA